MARRLLPFLCLIACSGDGNGTTPTDTAPTDTAPPPGPELTVLAEGEDLPDGDGGEKMEAPSPTPTGTPPIRDM